MTSDKRKKSGVASRESKPIELLTPDSRLQTPDLFNYLDAAVGDGQHDAIFGGVCERGRVVGGAGLVEDVVAGAVGPASR